MASEIRFIFFSSELADLMPNPFIIRLASFWFTLFSVKRTWSDDFGNHDGLTAEIRLCLHVRTWADSMILEISSAGK